MTTQERLLHLTTYPPAAYEAIDLNRLTVFVIDLLAEMNIATSIENIAVASFRFFPLKFQMCAYPQFPDISRTNRALLQLRPKYRGWATGSTKRGFALNAAGEEVARMTRQMLGSSSGVPAPAEREPRLREAGEATLDAKRLLEQVRESECYLKYRAGQGPRGLDFLDMLNAYSHTPAEELKRSLKRLQNLARDESDQHMLDFLESCRTMFAIYLEPTSTGKGAR